VRKLNDQEQGLTPSGTATICFPALPDYHSTHKSGDEAADHCGGPYRCVRTGGGHHLNGRADFVALARAILYNPRWSWHAAAHFGASVRAPKQYLRSQPHRFRDLFRDSGSGEQLRS